MSILEIPEGAEYTEETVKAVLALTLQRDIESWKKKRAVALKQNTDGYLNSYIAIIDTIIRILDNFVNSL